MRVLYIGSKDELAIQFARKMQREEYDLFFFCDEDLNKGNQLNRRVHFYKLSSNKSIQEEMFESVSPDIIVFAGYDFTRYRKDIHIQENLTLLNQTLEICKRIGIKKFIYLSSTGVYGNGEHEIYTEDSSLVPAHTTDLQYIQGEYAVQIWNKGSSVCTVILRCSPVYSEVCQINGADFLSYQATEVEKNQILHVKKDSFVQLLHLSDLVEAIKCTIIVGKEGVYNVTSAANLKQSKLYILLAQLMGKEIEVKVDDPEEGIGRIDGQKIRRDFEWVNTEDLERNLIAHQIKIERCEEEKSQKSRWNKIKKSIYKSIENVCLFGFFFMLASICQEHALFQQIDFLLIYVMLVSLFLGLKHSSIAVVLASAGVFAIKGVNILEVTNFYSHVSTLLVIVEFIFFGLIISYTIDSFKQLLDENKKNQALLEEQFAELKAINDENVFIKQQYEKRILDTKTSLSILYTVMSQINALRQDQIFIKVLDVVSELMETNTVAVYKKTKNMPFLRLISSLNDHSSLGGKSFNIAFIPGMSEALEKGELFLGDIWRNEPALAVPIMCEGQCVAAIVIKEMPYGAHTLYHMNIMRTLSSMITEAVVKAIEYEYAMQHKDYIEGTEILCIEAMQRKLSMAKEAKAKGVSEYALVRVEGCNNIIETYEAIKNRFRDIDEFGINDKNELFVLLKNTSEKESQIVIKRLKEYGIQLEIVSEQEYIGDEGRCG
ncbi:MAG: NAD(P)-dependent oxidoreductase [Niameybacter sp.]|nr:NAD(P)-dependent oxidoreductase [Niameybacter sp.]